MLKTKIMTNIFFILSIKQAKIGSKIIWFLVYCSWGWVDFQVFCLISFRIFRGGGFHRLVFSRLFRFEMLISNSACWNNISYGKSNFLESVRSQVESFHTNTHQAHLWAFSITARIVFIYSSICDVLPLVIDFSSLKNFLLDDIVRRRIICENLVALAITWHISIQGESAVIHQCGSLRFLTRLRDEYLLHNLHVWEVFEI